MNLGKKIFELRKEKKLSQEELAEKLNVTRQTISRWELDETTPDIKQAKELSKIFKVSLDEMLDNDVKEILTEKVSNTERLAGIAIKIMKMIGLIFLIFLIIFIYKIFYPTYVFDVGVSRIGEDKYCVLGDKEYIYSIDSNEDGTVNKINIDPVLKYKLSLNSYRVDYQVEDAIKLYFEENGGRCE